MNGLEIGLSIGIPLILGALGWLYKMLMGIRKQVEDLHVWHNKEDSDGVKVWYIRSSLEAAVVRLAEAVEKLAPVLDKIHQEVKESRRDVSELKKVFETH
ncbi:MAG: hypothetical protein V3T77_11275 [Planctomycetota bacterium]